MKKRCSSINNKHIEFIKLCHPKLYKTESMIVLTYPNEIKNYIR